MSERFILKSMMNVEPSPDVDLYTFMETSFRKNYNNLALVDAKDDSHKITFYQLELAANLIAQHLMTYGFTRESTLVLYSENCFEYALISVAALRLGGKFAAVNHQLTSSELERLLELCDGDFVFTSSGVASKVISATFKKHCHVKTIFVKGENQGCTLPSMSSLNINPRTDVACILFSSGTTGMQKATQLSHRNMVAAIDTICAPQTRILGGNNLIFVPMSHFYGIGVTLFGFSAGTTTILASGFDMEGFLKNVEKYKVVPPIAVLLAKHPLTERFDLTSVETVICGNAPLSANIERELCDKLKGPRVKVVQLYGLTETCGAVTGSYMDESLKPRDLPPPPPGSCGLLLSNYEAKVVDIKTGKTLGHGQDGELLFRGPQIMLGYQKNELATHNTIDQDGWLHSGDIGHYDENGYFFIVDRLKELIKYKGLQVPPAELEALLLTHPDIADCAVVGLPDEMAGELPHAWVVPKPDAKLCAEDVIKFVESNAAPYKRLRGGVKFVEAIPKSPSGKMLRREIKAHMVKSKL